MKKQNDGLELLAAWNEIPTTIQNAIKPLAESDLNLKVGSEGWSIRETAHHLVEANLVASNMIIAALAADGCDYDWTWVNPDKRWMQRVGYDSADVNLAIKMLRALCRHLSALISAQPQALARTVKVNDTPGAPRYVLTIEEILRQEIEHANEHLAVIREIRTLKGTIP